MVEVCSSGRVSFGITGEIGRDLFSFEIEADAVNVIKLKLAGQYEWVTTFKS